jgi:hypothetical protein
MSYTRRRFLATLSMVGASGLLGAPSSAAAEGVLETTTVRLADDGGICFSPGVAEELLRAEGFTDVRYVPMIGEPRTFASAGVDFKGIAPWDVAVRLDGGEAVVVLGGVHIGCFELFAREGIRSVADLKGKSVGSDWTRLLALMAAAGGQPGNTSAIIRSRPSGCCGRSSRPLNSALANRRVPRSGLSKAGLSDGMTMPSRR